MSSLIKTLFLFVSLSSGLFLQGYGQDFRTTFMEMKQKYDSLKSFHIIMEVKASEHENSPPFYAEKFELKKEGINYVYSSKDNFMLMNESHIVLVDKEARQMSVSTRNKKAEQELNGQVKFNLDSILSKNTVPQYLGEHSDRFVYSQQLKQGPVKTMSMYIDKHTGLLSRVEYHYREAQFVSVDFNLFDDQPSFGPETFADASVIMLEKGKYKPSAAFKGFQIIAAHTK